MLIPLLGGDDIARPGAHRPHTAPNSRQAAEILRSVPPRYQILCGRLTAIGQTSWLKNAGAARG
jgi:hypothetical protein